MESKRAPAVSIFILLATFPFASVAEIFRWVDEKGGVHFGATPPKDPNVVGIEWTADRESKIRDAKEWLPPVQFKVDMPTLSKDEIHKRKMESDAGQVQSTFALAVHHLFTKSKDKNIAKAISYLTRPEMESVPATYSILVAIYTGHFGDEYFDLKQARKAAFKGAEFKERLPLVTTYAFLVHEAAELRKSPGAKAAQDQHEKLSLAIQLFELLPNDDKDRFIASQESILSWEKDLAPKIQAMQETQRVSKWARAPRSGRVANSGWDGSVRGVEQYLEEVLHDPDSLEVESWGYVETNGSAYRVLVSYRAKNGFGAYRKTVQRFYLTTDGSVYEVEDVSRDGF